MDDILKEERFDYISNENKAFILAFNKEMTRLGYDFVIKSGGGGNWGKYMIVYTKSGVKSKNVYARIYLRETSIVLRLFFSDIDKHREFIEKTPKHINEVFTGDFGTCLHEHDKPGGKCEFRKSYTLDGRLIEKCNGTTFEFHRPSMNELEDYIALFTEFFPAKKAKARPAA